jgi:thymidine kinase
MNAGKSTALLQVAHNYEENERSVVVYTSEHDHRYGVGIVTSRLGPQRKAVCFDAETNFFDAIAAEHEISCVLVDEAQFLQVEQVKQLHRAAHVLGVPVICYGLRSDFLGDPFPGAAHLLTVADSLEELKTICSCGRKATMNVRVDDRGNRIIAGEQIAIEGDVRYLQVCGRCFYQGEKAPAAPSELVRSG